jgi:hypothetical protein
MVADKEEVEVKKWKVAYEDRPDISRPSLARGMV